MMKLISIHSPFFFFFRSGSSWAFLPYSLDSRASLSLFFFFSVPIYPSMYISIHTFFIYHFRFPSSLSHTLTHSSIKTSHHII
ncbi:uncharacterized protein BX664DRAFT_359298 [Halteromyces radiatus]|uniref:uncharacterized protein n=1 Tax=Halteromyces radiatus TaxID=101107 RepID=UPI00221E9EB9|nr:uncharacterized protein BX664DRAFT_359298 [Halteromyces radiatus]KAI8089786.1 hypothetical protein BX664DRAFT_359298 [Halteromyces radiatus]